MKKTLLAALLLGTTVTTNVDAAMVVYNGEHQSANTHTSQPSALTNPYSVVAGLSRGVATTVYYVGKEVVYFAGRVISSFFQKNETYVPTHSMNEPFGNEAPHVHRLAMKSDVKDGSVTPPSTRAASVEPATPEAPEAIEKDDDRMSASFSSELDLLMNAEPVAAKERADGLLVTPRVVPAAKPVADYSEKERAELEAFIQMVLAEGQKATGKDTHDPLEDSIVFTEEDSIVFEEEAATPSEASTEAAKPTVKPAAKTTKKPAPTVRMTRAQQLLAQSKAAENAAKVKEEKKAPKPAGKKPAGKTAVAAH